ncbi:tetratricopeptide (TPR) repeat protein [Croceifilum oryzae]|uniref:Tetratricopeptide (TPR) repeat protein n=1 Tax=Croceifilum oryzae TaxID=1553429 RepID=A0AAJ1TI87_9BACL|nr:helix-turn-helix domain-containing protein [Croceifilum oryzae]MDQ0416631.1 tetratricopeptide (TPR) repeat protein [Croceifilum oryzae]
MKTCIVDSDFIVAHHIEIGRLIRKVRIEKGMTLKDLDHGEASISTISNIERGTGQHTPDRIKSLLEKVGIQLEELPYLLDQEKNHLKQVQFHLDVSETLISAIQYQEALQELEKVVIQDFHHQAPLLSFLRGKCMKGLGKLKQALKQFQHAIRLSKDVSKTESLETSFYGEMAICMYQQNDIEQAIEYTNQGINAFTKGGNRQDDIIKLYLNKSVFCYKLNHADGLGALDKVAEFLDQTSNIDIKLRYYWLKADQTRKAKQFEEALKYANKGLKLAQLNKLFNMIVEFWICLGSILASMRNLEEAKMWFQIALKFQHDDIEPRSKASANLRLGALYSLQKVWEDAKSFLTTAQEMAITSNDAPKHFWSLLLLGDVEINTSNHSLAIQQYQHAQELANKFSFTKFESMAWSRLANAWENVDSAKYQFCTSRYYELQQTISLKGDYYDDDEIF